MKSKKIIDILELKKIITKKKFKISLVHGVFDILHVGHKRYFEDARQLSDKLIVSITTDKFVNKGPNRPIFNQNLRAEILSAFECVDYIILSNEETAVKVINILKPNFYVKGNDYKDLRKDLTKNIYKEKSAVEKHNGKIIFSDDIQFSSSNIINSFYKPETILNEIIKLKINKKRFSEKSWQSLDQIKKLKVGIIGEIIFDEYIYSKEMNKPSKENIHAVNFIKKETYAGGTLAIAKNLSEFCNEVNVFSAGIFNSDLKKIILSTKNKFRNIKTHIDKSNFQIIKKTRILNETNDKIFEIYNKKGDNKYKYSNIFLKLLKRKLKNFDVIILCDYGHGYFDTNMYNTIIKNSKKVSINVQTNSDNRGFNLITKYNKANLICIDEPEIRLALSDRFSSIDKMAKKISKKIKFNTLIVTRGNSGITIYKKKLRNKFSKISLSAFELKPIDTIGAGDSVLGIASLLDVKNINIEVMAFLGNIFGALTTKYLGHSSHLSKKDVSKAITYTLK